MNDRFVAHYRLDEVLGSGSMGRVWKAWDQRLQRWVAIKFLPPELSDDERACARFQREAQAASSLEHGHICTIYDFNRDEDGTAYLVMAWYDGRTLEQVLADGTLPPAQACAYARQIALALGAAHRQGIVHRDIKPANLMITRDDEAVILDFGVAYLTARTRLSRPGSQTGTLAYMAPEQFRGSDPAATMDVWSLGVLLFEMLTGRLPFIGEYPAALMFAIAHEEPAPVPAPVDAVLPGIGRVVAKCLAREPGDRYRSGAELAADLAAIGGGTGRVATSRRRLRLPTGRWGRRAVAGVAAVLLVAVGLVAGTMILSRSGRAPDAGPRPPSDGIAVLPFTLEEGGAERTELGAGLAWLVADELHRVAGDVGDFWVVPGDDILLYGITDRRTVWDQLGVGRAVSGTGTLDGSTLTVRLEYADAGSGESASTTFRDDVANLPTWQSGLAAWVLARLVPPGAAPGREPELAPITQVPEAFYAYLEGLGWSRPYVRDPELRAERVRQALAAFGRAVARDSSFAAARGEYAGALLQPLPERPADWTELCRSHLRAAMALDPTSPAPHAYAGRLGLATGDTAGAVAAFDRALVLDPGHKPALLAKFELALATGDDRATAGAAAAMGTARPGYAGDDLARGVRYFAMSDITRSIICFRSAVAAAPRSARALYYLGAATWEQERSPEAQSLFKRALAAEPASPMQQAIRYNLATTYYYEGRYASALEEYQRTLEFDPRGNYDIWRGIAECYRWSPGYQDSVVTAYTRTRRLAERSLVLRPDDANLKAELATFCSVLGDTGRTLELLDELAGAPHRGAETEFMMAVAWEDLGRRNRALACLDAALDQGLRMTRVEGYPGLRNLRADPRYAQLVTEHRP